MGSAEHGSVDPSSSFVGTESESNSKQQNGHTNDLQVASSVGSDSRTLHETATLQENSAKIINFAPDDPAHPNNWPSSRKSFIVTVGILNVLNSTIGSSLPSNAIVFIARDLNVTNDTQLVLPISTYLLGYTIAPVLFGPLSENYGRKIVMCVAFASFIIWTMACAVAPSWWSLLLFRFFGGISASAPIAVVGGLYADIYHDPGKRGLAMTIFMVATTLGPIVSPILSGFIADNTSWRWVFGTAALFAAAAMPLMILLPETYAPVLLSRRAAKMSQDTGEKFIAKTDLQKKSLRYIVTVVLTRPWRMLFQELIVACVCAYCALAYAIFYLYFAAYPLIFQGVGSVYGWSPGVAGLAFIPIGVGAILCIPIFYWWNATLEKARRAGAAWAQKEEYRRLPLACLGGPLYVISLFWIGWSSRRNVHWIVPVLSGIPFGMGFDLIFIALINYLSDAYETFAASAQGIGSTCRSIFGALLPLATHRMFKTLGIDWACTLLAFVSLGMALIPFAFIRYGDTIRAGSKFCQELKVLKQLEANQPEPARHATATIEKV